MRSWWVSSFASPLPASSGLTRQSRRLQNLQQVRRGVRVGWAGLRSWFKRGAEGASALFFPPRLAKPLPAIGPPCAKLVPTIFLPASSRGRGGVSWEGLAPAPVSLRWLPAERTGWPLLLSCYACKWRNNGSVWLLRIQGKERREEGGFVGCSLGNKQHTPRSLPGWLASSGRGGESGGPGHGHQLGFLKKKNIKISFSNKPRFYTKDPD